MGDKNIQHPIHRFVDSRNGGKTWRGHYHYQSTDARGTVNIHSPVVVNAEEAAKMIDKLVYKHLGGEASRPLLNFALSAQEKAELDALPDVKAVKNALTLQVTQARRAAKAAEVAADPSKRVSKWRGVSWRKKKQKWEAQITIEGKQKFLGYFEDEDEAARAYDKAAVAKEGTKAKVNFPAEVVDADGTAHRIGPGTDNQTLMTHEGWEEQARIAREAAERAAAEGKEAPDLPRVDVAKLRADMNFTPAPEGQAKPRRRKATGARVPRGATGAAAVGGGAVGPRGRSRSRSRSRSRARGGGAASAMDGGDSEGEWDDDYDALDDEEEWEDDPSVPYGRRLTRGLEAQMAERELERKKEDDGYDGWADSPESCVHCGQSDYQEGFGPRTLIICSSCGALGTHVECEEGATGIPIQEHHVRGMCEWHCSDACAAVARDLDRCVDQRFDVPFVEGVAGTEPGAEKKDKLTYEVAAFDPHHQPAVRTCRMALRLLQAAFDPLQMQEGRADRDLLTMIVHRQVDDEGAEGARALKELYDFSQFRTMLVKKGSNAVGALVFRIFGTRCCEVPFVTVREEVRRQGVLRGMLAALTERLERLKVRVLLVPAATSSPDPSQPPPAAIWRGLGFGDLREYEEEALGDHIISPDPSSCIILKKRLIEPEGRRGGRGRSGSRGRGGAGRADKGGSRSRSKSGGKGKGKGGPSLRGKEKGEGMGEEEEELDGAWPGPGPGPAAGEGVDGGGDELGLGGLHLGGGVDGGLVEGEVGEDDSMYGSEYESDTSEGPPAPATPSLPPYLNPMLWDYDPVYRGVDLQTPLKPQEFRDWRAGRGRFQDYRYPGGAGGGMTMEQRLDGFDTLLECFLGPALKKGRGPTGPGAPPPRTPYTSEDLDYRQFVTVNEILDLYYFVFRYSDPEDTLWPQEAVAVLVGGGGGKVDPSTFLPPDTPHPPNAPRNTSFGRSTGPLPPLPDDPYYQGTVREGIDRRSPPALRCGLPPSLHPRAWVQAHVRGRDQSSLPSLSDPLRCRLALLGCRLDLARLPEMELGGREARLERLRAATGMLGVWFNQCHDVDLSDLRPTLEVEDEGERRAVAHNISIPDIIRHRLGVQCALYFQHTWVKSNWERPAPRPPAPPPPALRPATADQKARHGQGFKYRPYWEQDWDTVPAGLYHSPPRLTSLRVAKSLSHPPASAGGEGELYDITWGVAGSVEVQHLTLGGCRRRFGEVWYNERWPRGEGGMGGETEEEDGIDVFCEVSADMASLMLKGRNQSSVPPHLAAALRGVPLVRGGARPHMPDRLGGARGAIYGAMGLIAADTTFTLVEDWVRPLSLLSPHGTPMALDPGGWGEDALSRGGHAVEGEEWGGTGRARVRVPLLSRPAYQVYQASLTGQTTQEALDMGRLPEGVGGEGGAAGAIGVLREEEKAVKFLLERHSDLLPPLRPAELCLRAAIRTGPIGRLFLASWMARTHADSLRDFLEGEGGGGAAGDEPGPSGPQHGQGEGAAGVSGAPAGAGRGGAGGAAAPPSEMDSLVATVLEGSMHVLEKTSTRLYMAALNLDAAGLTAQEAYTDLIRGPRRGMERDAAAGSAEAAAATAQPAPAGDPVGGSGAAGPSAPSARTPFPLPGPFTPQATPGAPAPGPLSPTVLLTLTSSDVYNAAVLAALARLPVDVEAYAEALTRMEAMEAEGRAGRMQAGGTNVNAPPHPEAPMALPGPGQASQAQPGGRSPAPAPPPAGPGPAAHATAAVPQGPSQAQVQPQVPLFSRLQAAGPSEAAASGPIFAVGGGLSGAGAVDSGPGSTLGQPSSGGGSSGRGHLDRDNGMDPAPKAPQAPQAHIGPPLPPLGPEHAPPPWREPEPPILAFEDLTGGTGCESGGAGGSFTLGQSGGGGASSGRGRMGRNFRNRGK